MTVAPSTRRTLTGLIACSLTALGLAAAHPAHAQSLFVGNLSSNTITKFNSAGVGAQFNVSGDVNLPEAFAFDAVGNLFAANYGDNTIEGIQSGGRRHPVQRQRKFERPRRPGLRRGGQPVCRQFQRQHH